MTWFGKESKIFPPSGGSKSSSQYPGQSAGDIPDWNAQYEYDRGTEVLAPDGSYYRCVVDHVASDDFNSDLVNWVIFAGPGVAAGAPTKSGTVLAGDFSGITKTANVVFSTAFDDANYTPTVTIVGEDNFNPSVINITASGFTIDLNSKVQPTQNVYWIAVKHGEY